MVSYFSLYATAVTIIAAGVWGLRSGRQAPGRIRRKASATAAAVALIRYIATEMGYLSDPLSELVVRNLSWSHWVVTKLALYFADVLPFTLRPWLVRLLNERFPGVLGSVVGEEGLFLYLETLGFVSSSCPEIRVEFCALTSRARRTLSQLGHFGSTRSTSNAMFSRSSSWAPASTLGTNV